MEIGAADFPPGQENAAGKHFLDIYRALSPRFELGRRYYNSTDTPLRVMTVFMEWASQMKRRGGRYADYHFKSSEVMANVGGIATFYLRYKHETTIKEIEEALQLAQWEAEMRS